MLRASALVSHSRVFAAPCSVLLLIVLSPHQPFLLLEVRGAARGNQVSGPEGLLFTRVRWGNNSHNYKQYRTADESFL